MLDRSLLQSWLPGGERPRSRVKTQQDECRNLGAVRTGVDVRLAWQEEAGGTPGGGGLTECGNRDWAHGGCFSSIVERRWALNWRRSGSES